MPSLAEGGEGDSRALAFFLSLAHFSLCRRRERKRRERARAALPVVVVGVGCRLAAAAVSSIDPRRERGGGPHGRRERERAA